MPNDTYYTAIDMGTTKMCTIIAKVGPEGELKVLGTGIVPSQGMHKGRVENIPETQEAVRASLDEAQRYLGRPITWAYLGVTGNHISCVNTTGLINSSGRDNSISARDVEQLIRSSCSPVSSGKEILHVIPMSYAVDGLRGVRNPVGLHAERLQLESHVVLGDGPILRNLVKAVEGCKVSVRSLVLQQIAAAEAALTEDEREVGVVLVDIGGGTTDVVLLKAGSPWYNAVIPVGGIQVTRDLSVATGLPFYAAEELKIRYGHANPEAIPADEEVQIPGYQGEPKRMVHRRALCQPIYERMAEILKMVLSHVKEAGLRQIPPGGIVLIGGSAELPGLADLVARATGSPTRIGYPDGIMGLPADLRKPGFSTSVGTLIWGIKHQGQPHPVVTGGNWNPGKQKSWFSKFKRSPEEVAA